MLSESQLKVVSFNGGPLFVVSGPGSGKTTVLTQRVARLINEGENPRSITISTFTNRAADEFKTRISKLLDGKEEGIRAGTLHSFGASILKQFGHYAGLPSDFVIFDSKNCLQIIRTILRDLRISRDACPSEIAFECITRYKEKLQTPLDVEKGLKAKLHISNFERHLLTVYQGYEQALRECNAVDFSDLIMRTVFLLRENGLVRSRACTKWILVDEAQDLDPSQFEMIDLLLDADRNLMLVGDVDQSIFRFRGAEPKLILGFKDRYPDGEIIPLGQNYRSTPQIVRAASALISKNTQRYDHQIWTENPEGERISLFSAPDPFSEGELVAKRIIEEVDSRGLQYTDVAVLYRTNFQSLALEEAMLEYGIPYNVVGSRFFERQEIQDLVLFLELVHNPQDESLVNELVGRPVCAINKKVWKKVLVVNSRRAESLWITLQRHKEITEEVFEQRQIQAFFNTVIGLYNNKAGLTLPVLVARILEATGLERWYEDRETQSKKSTGVSPLENIAQFISMCSKRFPGDAATELPKVIEYVDRMVFKVSSSSNVQLMTLHSAKGTEFPVVFIVGVEEGLIPHWRASQDEHVGEALEEERRLLYVGATRAEERLFLSHSKERIHPTRGKVSCVPSRFLYELPEELTVKI